jgi:hypothetical protein
VNSLSAYGLRAVVARPSRALALIAALGLAAAALAVSLCLLAVVGLRIGPTLLAEALGARLQPYQVALLALDAVGALGFCLLALRSDLLDRRPESRVLAALGWRPRQRRRALTWQRFWLALPAALLAVLLAFALGPLLLAGMLDPGVIAATAGLLALSVLVWGPLAGWRLGGA